MDSDVKRLLGELDNDSFVSLLRKLIGESKYLQNNPPDLIPEEDRAVKHVLDSLLPFSASNGGPLVVNHVTYHSNRGNLIVEYPGTEPDRVLSFVGCHMDVVTANPDDWEFDPFSLSIDGDKLRGRGTTDCLGHVALIAELMKKLGETKPKLKSTVVAVFIANEENSAITGVGVDALVKDGLLNNLKNGPLFWIDTADKQPCIGTGGMIPWKLNVTGKLFHSGLAHKAVNSLELAMEATKEIQSRFYRDFPPHPQEEVYGFATPSTMKPTQWSYPGGGINQIPGECIVSGDVRLTPFYSVTDVMKKLQEYVDDINANIEKLDTRGPVSKYVLPDENITGRLSISFEEAMSGVACDLNSRGFHVLCKATEEVVGHVKPYSITGSLPLIRDLKDEGFDVQTSGYGLMATYHAKNEYCLLSDMGQGYLVFVSIISQLEENLPAPTLRRRRSLLHAPASSPLPPLSSSVGEFGSASPMSPGGFSQQSSPPCSSKLLLSLSVLLGEIVSTCFAAIIPIHRSMTSLCLSEFSFNGLFAWIDRSLLPACFRPQSVDYGGGNYGLPIMLPFSTGYRVCAGCNNEIGFWSFLKLYG